MKWEGGSAPRRMSSGIRVGSVVRAVRSPQAAASFGIRLALRQALSQLAMTALLPFIFPLISMLIMPFIQKIIKDYFDAELKRRLEDERRQTLAEVYATLNADDRARLRVMVAE